MVSNNTGTNDNGTTNNGSSGTSPSANPNASPTDGLITGLKQIKDSGPPDVKLSTQTKEQYLALIGGFHDELMAQRRKIVAIAPLGDPGTLGSATQTSANLTMDVSGPGGITEMLDKYLTYLDDFTDTLNKAATRLIQSG